MQASYGTHAGKRADGTGNHGTTVSPCAKSQRAWPAAQSNLDHPLRQRTTEVTWMERPGDEDPSGESAECGRRSFRAAAATHPITADAEGQHICGTGSPWKECEMARERRAGVMTGVRCILLSLRISVNRSALLRAFCERCSALNKNSSCGVCVRETERGRGLVTLGGLETREILDSSEACSSLYSPRGADDTYHTARPFHAHSMPALASMLHL